MERAAGCEGKDRFPTFARAAQVARRSRRHDSNLAPYPCRFCGGFHVGNAGGGSAVGKGIDPRQRYIVFATGPDARELLIGYSNDPDGGTVARRVTETAGWLVSRIVDRKPYLSGART